MAEMRIQPTKAAGEQGQSNWSSSSPIKKKQITPRVQRVVEPVELKSDTPKQRGKVWKDLRASMANSRGIFRGLRGSAASSRTSNSSSSSSRLQKSGSSTSLQSDSHTGAGEEDEEEDDDELYGLDSNFSSIASGALANIDGEFQVELFDADDLDDDDDDNNDGDVGMEEFHTPQKAREFFAPQKHQQHSSTSSPRERVQHNRQVKPVTEDEDDTGDSVNGWGREFQALPMIEGGELSFSPSPRRSRKKKKSPKSKQERRQQRRNRNSSLKSHSASPRKKRDTLGESWGDLASLQESPAKMAIGSLLMKDGVGVRSSSCSNIDGVVNLLSAFDAKKGIIPKKDSFTNLDEFNEAKSPKWQEVFATMDAADALHAEDFDPTSLNQLLGEDMVVSESAAGASATAATTTTTTTGVDESFEYGMFYEEDDDDGGENDNNNTLKFPILPPFFQVDETPATATAATTTTSQDPIFKVMEQLLMEDDPLDDAAPIKNQEVTTTTTTTTTTPSETAGVKLHSDEGEASSFGTAPETDDSDNSGDIKKERSIRFSDELGLPMHTIFHLDKAKNRLPEMARMVILVLCPKDRKFEFVHAEYQFNIKTSVKDLLEQLPTLASNSLFTDKVYDKLFRRSNSDGAPSEMDPSMALCDCGLEKGEVVIGGYQGCEEDEVTQCALPLLVNTKITRAVKHARRTGRGLKYILTGKELLEKKERRLKKAAQKETLERLKLKLMVKDEKSPSHPEFVDDDSDTPMGENKTTSVLDHYQKVITGEEESKEEETKKTLEEIIVRKTTTGEVEEPRTIRENETTSVLDHYQKFIIGEEESKDEETKKTLEEIFIRKTATGEVEKPRSIEENETTSVLDHYQKVIIGEEESKDEETKKTLEEILVRKTTTGEVEEPRPIGENETTSVLDHYQQVIIGEEESKDEATKKTLEDIFVRKPATGQLEEPRTMTSSFATLTDPCTTDTTAPSPNESNDDLDVPDIFEDAVSNEWDAEGGYTPPPAVVFLDDPSGPQKIVQYLHAGLVATAGILYSLSLRQ